MREYRDSHRGDRRRRKSLRGERYRREDGYRHRRSRSRSPTRSRRRSHSPRRRRDLDVPSPSGWHRKRSRSPSAESRGRSGALLHVGAIYRARVHTIKPFGVFVALEGQERHALVHHSQISEDLSLDRDDPDEDKCTALEYFAPPGSQIWVKITEIKGEESGSMKVNASMRVVDQESGQDLDPRNMSQQTRSHAAGPLSDEPPALGSIHKASVMSHRPFGVFVRLEGFRSNGLVHFSQISDHLELDRDASDEEKTASIAAVLNTGESCWVKVVEIKDGEPGRGPKIGCSIKLVSQKDGTDLDPHSLKYKPRGGEGAGFESRTARPVGAAAGQSQQGLVDWGYLNADKVSLNPNYADYELLGAEDEELAAGHLSAQNEALPPPPERRKPQPLPDRGVNSVEEALEILQKHKDKRRKHKDKARAKKKKKKQKEEKKSRKEKKRKKDTSSSSSSGSD